MQKNLAVLVLLALGVGILASGCASNQSVVGAAGHEQGVKTSDAPNVLQVSDIPVPPGARFDAETSLIIGTADRWLGRIVIKTDMASVQAYNHFYNGMPSLGWGLVTTVQGKSSSLTYMRGERIASVLVEPASISGSMVTITVSPKQMGGQK